MEKIKQCIFTMFLCAVLIIQLTACGEKEVLGDAEPQMEYAYKASASEVSGVKGDFDNFAHYGGKMYFTSDYYPDRENDYWECYLNMVNTDGSGFSSVLLASGAECLISPLAFDLDGRGYYIETKREEDEIVDTLVEIDKEGNETGRVEITGMIAEHLPNFYASKAYVFGEDIYFANYSEVLAMKPDGSFIGSVADASGIQSLFEDGEGNIYAYLWNGNGYDLCGVDISSGQLGQNIQNPFDGYGNEFLSGGDSGYDFLVSDGTKMYGYNLDEDKTELLNFANAGISMLEVTDILYCGNEKFVCAGKSHPYKYPKFFELSKQLVEKTDKTEITLAGTDYSVDKFIENSVVKFNASNDKYYITIKKYPYENIEQLNMDIISGNVPDILISDSSMPVDNYIAKGIFTDLYEYMDADDEIKRSDFLQNLMAACENEQKLYRFTDRFQVYTVIGKTSIFGDDYGITTDRLEKIAGSRPENTEILPASTKNDILSTAMEISGDDFIDYKRGKCSFNSDKFIKMLQYADTYISESDYETYFDENFWGRFDTMYADESALLMLAYLSDYSDIYRFEQVNFGERVTAVGFPREDGVGTSFIINTGFSISEKSKNKDGAWEFVKTLLLPEHQDSCDNFPVRIDALEKQAAAAMEYDPERVNYAIVLMGQMMLTSGRGDIGEPTKEDIDRVNDIIASANGLMKYDEVVMKIILEEAAAYFEGEKSAEAVAELIQVRVQLYLDENSV